MRLVRALALITLLHLWTSPGAAEVRIGDLATVNGVHSNQLYGYGLVTGLEGTGDSLTTQFAARSLANLLNRFGISADPEQMIVNNIAAVIVTAQLPPFARAGDQIDAVVSSVGSAKSLQGGILLQTPLQGADGVVYAVAQGPVSIGGFNVQTGLGGKSSKNHPTVGLVPGGAIVEREVLSRLSADGRLRLVLRSPDFTVAQTVAAAVSAQTGAAAQATDAALVVITPSEEQRRNLVGFIAQVQAIRVPVEAPARVVINERTGTVIVGGNVRILPVAVAHGALTVEIKRQLAVSQPPPFSGGETVVVPQEEMRVEEQRASLVMLDPGDTVEDVVRALNALGVTPRDLVAIFQSLKAAGALTGELIVL